MPIAPIAGTWHARSSHRPLLNGNIPNTRLGGSGWHAATVPLNGLQSYEFRHVQTGFAGLLHTARRVRQSVTAPARATRTPSVLHLAGLRDFTEARLVDGSAERGLLTPAIAHTVHTAVHARPMDGPCNV